MLYPNFSAAEFEAKIKCELDQRGKMQPASPNIDWGGLINKGLLMAVPTIIRIFWPYILLLAILFGIKYALSSRKPGARISSYSAQENTPLSAASNPVSVPQPSAPRASCALCGEAVSEKVEAYCRTHATEFGGRIYCFEHQKTARTNRG
jgi:hypothetical protein